MLILHKKVKKTRFFPEKSRIFHYRAHNLVLYGAFGVSEGVPQAPLLLIQERLVMLRVLV